MKLEDYIDEYLQEITATGKSPNTVKAYKQRLSSFARFCNYYGYDFRTFNGKGSRHFRNWLLDLGLKPASINATISAVKSFYDFLVEEEEEVKGNPIITKRLRVAEEKSLPAFLTEEEIQKVFAYIEKLQPHIALAFRTMYACGLRVSETANLIPEDVIIQQGRVFVMVRHGKGNKSRMVPVTDVAVAHELLRLAQEKEKEKGTTLFGVKNVTFKWYAQQISFETGVDFHCHRLRHTFATKLLSEGVPLDVVQEVLGHENINTTRKYAKTAPDRIYQLAVEIA